MPALRIASRPRCHASSIAQGPYLLLHLLDAVLQLLLPAHCPSFRQRGSIGVRTRSLQLLQPPLLVTERLGELCGPRRRPLLGIEHTSMHVSATVWEGGLATVYTHGGKHSLATTHCSLLSRSWRYTISSSRWDDTCVSCAAKSSLRAANRFRSSVSSSSARPNLSCTLCGVARDTAR